MCPNIVPNASAELDRFVAECLDLFKSFLLARTSHELGDRLVDSLVDSTLVTATVGIGIRIEPIPIDELRAFKSVYPDFVIEVFHGRLVQRWNDLLHKIVGEYLDLHLAGTRQLTEMKTRQVKLDFRDACPLDKQIRAAVLRSFDFDRYQERFRLVDCILGGGTDIRGQAEHIRRHIQIRNAFQHHNGHVRTEDLVELGCNELVLLDESGTDQPYLAGSRLHLCVPELDKFRRSLLQVVHQWKQ